MLVSLKRKTLFQLLFWIFIASINYMFAFNIMSPKSALLACSVNTLFQMLAFYLNTFWVFPKFFNRPNYIHYFLVSLFTILLIATMQTGIELTWLQPLIEAKIPNIQIPRFFIALRIFVWLSLMYVISLVFLTQEKLNQEMSFKNELVEEKLEAELELLKNQIQPHFIFNALNNIYSLAYRKSDETPDSILKLSEMLRYVLEDCAKDNVLLQQEIDYIKNYISFKKMKTPYKEHISFDYSEADPAVQLAPMLFIPFIENSFKYSRIEEFPNAYIDISLRTSLKKIYFHLQNSIPPGSGAKSGSGTGIKNVQKRLDILYPEDNKLDITDEEYCFDVKLELNIGE
ncbi:sensor histidine kinase [Gracilimonas mengyeensis]|uniref:Histidine kinase n=1 Tax=Gracilimonas mengyeensis TaxID=1302730 RepID=A0A521BV71_9BACT|nr:histidine kinase [Gracilimonas mengyeensis]SMO51067.1 Histidine kinase [Gracilimonas mengyeensis]